MRMIPILSPLCGVLKAITLPTSKIDSSFVVSSFLNVRISRLFISIPANAQVLKKDLLKDYKPGDQLEKAVYGDKKEPIRTDSWNGAFSTNPLEGVGSPLVGKALSYKGYPEGGLSIDIGNFPADIKRWVLS